MEKIGIFFGTDSGTTRLIAKKIAKKLQQRLGESVTDKPLNINRVTVDDWLSYRMLILGTPTYGEGLLPGKEADNKDASWAEFLPTLVGRDLSGVRIALFGLGDQESYPTHFVDGIMLLYRALAAAGAQLVGGCDTAGYEFQRSEAVVDGRFVGLALDQHLQPLLTDRRIDAWLDEVLPALIGREPGLEAVSAAV